jgi:hypothetical protein
MAHRCYRSDTKVLFESSNRNQHRRSRNRRFSAASVFLRPQHSAAEPQPEADSSLRCASLGMTCYSECYMSLRPTHRDEVDSSVVLSAATIGFSSRLAKSLPISATEHGVSSVSSLFRLCRSQSTRTRFGRRQLPRSVRQKAAPGEGVPAGPSAYPISIYPIDNPNNYAYTGRLRKRGCLSC